MSNVHHYLSPSARHQAPRVPPIPPQPAVLKPIPNNDQCLTASNKLFSSEKDEGSDSDE